MTTTELIGWGAVAWIVSGVLVAAIWGVARYNGWRGLQ